MPSLKILVKQRRQKRQRRLVLMSIMFPNHWEPVSPTIDPEEWIDDDDEE